MKPDGKHPGEREAEVHIASFVVQHRPNAAARVAAAVAAYSDLELAVAGATGSVVVCESADRRVLTERIDALRETSGVLNVLLVYHHAEPRAALEQPIDPPSQAD
ncbi:chaperone NapD [Lysobacter sp. BMK333-48F3]|uniref:chaperone NapD n=1 Tax=Lysobacter sp. BMK333-48F3 TaxID=2867962 RepID=UPI001C8B351B|nr:chaperone NapD [Lysobacter sp. BMK333-48F3]MBX9402618.1 chaperone NapD [Lysobacter sp. BMK333-48F3]